MVWIRIGTVADFPPGEWHVRHLLGRPVGVRATQAGAIEAREFACRHQGADLSAGPREGSVVTCPRHGWRYDSHSGACLTAPAMPLRPLPARVEGGRIYVDPTPSPEDDSGQG